MAYDFKTFEARSAEVVEWLGKEYNSIRTGRATPSLLDGVQVESYGAKVPINQVGSVGIEDPRTLRVTAWSQDSIVDIEKSIMNADLGVSVSVDDTGVRVSFPELTSERREQLLKLAKTKLEEARVSVRSARDEAVKDIEHAHKEGDISENEKFNTKETLQKHVDNANEKLNELFAKKEVEINQ